MTLRITDWRCSTDGCGSVLLDEVVVLNGWVEKTCRKCRQTAHIGATRNGEVIYEIRCPIEPHKLAEASSTWQGAIVTYCRRCKETVTLTAKRTPA